MAPGSFNPAIPPAGVLDPESNAEGEGVGGTGCAGGLMLLVGASLLNSAAAAPVAVAVGPATVTVCTMVLVIIVVVASSAAVLLALEADNRSSTIVLVTAGLVTGIVIVGPSDLSVLRTTMPVGTSLVLVVTLLNRIVVVVVNSSVENTTGPEKLIVRAT